MSKRQDQAHQEEVERAISRKEERLRHRDRERHKKLFTFIGIALGLAVALVLVGVVYQFLVLPNMAAAKVGDVSISTSQFQRRVRFDRNSMQNQLTRLQQLEQQFGGQGFFQTQIAQLQATLASPFSIGSQSLDSMIEDIVIAREVEARGITVSDEEVEVALREEVANGLGLVTEAQATATAEAAVAATATAAQFTPTAVPTPDPSAAITTTEAAATPTEPPPAAVITDTGFTEGLATLESSLQASSGLSLNEYRDIIRARLLREKLATAIGEEKVVGTEEQVHARHILLTVAEPTPEAPITGTEPLTAAIDSGLSVTPTGEVTVTGDVTAGADMTGSTAVTETSAPAVTGTNTVTTTAAVTDTAAVSPTVAVTSTTGVTAAADMTGTAGVTDTTGITETADVRGTAGITDTQVISGTHGPYTDAEALALANELRSRILAGEDFAALAQAYSDDTGSAANGGDLGWFGKGRMVAPFEEAVFALPVGQVSEPVKTDFGYHLIEVLEKDPARAKDENQLAQERSQAFQSWLSDQLASDQIERPGDLTSLLPAGF